MMINMQAEASCLISKALFILVLSIIIFTDINTDLVKVGNSFE